MPAGMYRSGGSGRVRYFDGSTPLPGSTNSSSWQQLSDHYRVVKTCALAAPHASAPDATRHPVRFAAGTVVSPGEYRNAYSGRVRYFDGTTPLPGGVNATSWQQVSDHFHAHPEQAGHDRRPLIAPPPVAPARELVTAAAPAATAVAAPPAPAPANAGELAVALVEHVAGADDEAVIALFAPDAHLFLPLGSLLVCQRGHAQLRRLLTWLRANLSLQTLDVERINGVEENVTVDFDTRGTTAAGVAFNRPGAMVVEARDGRIRLVHLALGAARV
ncbi:MAG TPA: nuclear transport factor 2 family protein [Candidatus Dormibacteraeota bacterium]|nr:nuclear transport factor 2 family protein [Candidatus Dormibacteraeota bacterium]